MSKKHAKQILISHAAKIKKTNHIAIQKWQGRLLDCQQYFLFC
jgi:hypothetical protein